MSTGVPLDLPLKLALAGDVMLGRLMGKSLDAGDYTRPWGDLLPVLRSVDRFLINLECALTSRTQRWSDGAFKAFYFRADPSAVTTLTAGRVDFASVANNHIGDFGPEGLRETIEVLDRAGIAHAGAGLDLARARAPALLTGLGRRVAVVAFTDHPKEWRATPTSPGVNYTPVSVAPEHFGAVRQALTTARTQADLVVFSMHWGPNMRARPTLEFRAFAHAVRDAGADIFWGHSAHVVQGMEGRGGRVILYDTGDLVDDYVVDPHLRNDLSALFLVEVGACGAEDVEVLPVQVHDLQANLARGRDRDWFLDRFTARCAELDTTLRVGPDRARFAVFGARDGAGRP